ncbi:MAG: hypothetical protein AB7I30_21240 [Isosphaeraceae bacterium]
MTRSRQGASKVQAPEKESERLAETPLLAAIHELRGEVERLIEDQKKLLMRASAAWEAEPAVVRGTFPSAPLVASPPALQVAGSAPTKPFPPPPKPAPEPGPAEPGGGDDIGRRLKDLNSRLERLKMAAQEAGESSARPGG